MKFKFTTIILAAGFGKRMMPLTKDLPKPLIDINGITLLDNSINFVKQLGCKQIIINTHYHHKKIEEAINKRKDKSIISLVYENKILDTGGAVKNAIPFFNHQNIMIVNSDIFWRKKNIIDIKKLINNYKNFKLPTLLLVKKKNSFGLKKNNGDFYLKNNKVLRFKKGKEILFYSGLQILNSNIFNNIKLKKFSLNLVWDNLIEKDNISADVMDSDWYHVGDIHGFNIAKELDT